MATSNNTDDDDARPRFPCLYDEVIEASMMAIIVFGMVGLRRLARESKKATNSGATEEEAILELPMASVALRDYYIANKEKVKGLMKTKIFDSMGHILGGGVNGELEPNIAAGTLHHVGDEREQQECVYCITTDSHRKAIYVSFRGSITLHDWIQDSKLVMADVDNPLIGQGYDDQPDMVRVHLGFREYLYNNAPSVLATSAKNIAESAKSTFISTGMKILKSPQNALSGQSSNSKIKQEGSSEKEKDDKEDLLNPPTPCKVDEILSKVQTLVDKLTDDYKVYIVGHSLGGALALILAMEAAAKLKTKMPVTCVTLGNPRAGNLNFRYVIQTLEEQGKLRCLCIHNHNDLVPKLPDVFSTCCYLCICRRSQTFRHVGLKMKLTDHDFSIVYHTRVNESMAKDMARQAQNFFRLLVSLPFVHECIRSKAFSARHDYEEYVARLRAQETKMRTMHMNTIYAEATKKAK